MIELPSLNSLPNLPAPQGTLACEQNPERWFFLGKPGVRNHAQEAHLEEVKEDCRACPVMGGCLRYALSNDERDGIWGATTPEERRAIKRGVQRREEAA